MKENPSLTTAKLAETSNPQKPHPVPAPRLSSVVSMTSPNGDMDLTRDPQIQTPTKEYKNPVYEKGHFDVDDFSDIEAADDDDDIPDEWKDDGQVHIIQRCQVIEEPTSDDDNSDAEVSGGGLWNEVIEEVEEEEEDADDLEEGRNQMKNTTQMFAQELKPSSPVCASTTKGQVTNKLTLEAANSVGLGFNHPSNETNKTGKPEPYHKNSDKSIFSAASLSSLKSPSLIPRNFKNLNRKETSVDDDDDDDKSDADSKTFGKLSKLETKNVNPKIVYNGDTLERNNRHEDSNRFEVTRTTSSNLQNNHKTDKGIPLKIDSMNIYENVNRQVNDQAATTSKLHTDKKDSNQKTDENNARKLHSQSLAEIRSRRYVDYTPVRDDGANQNKTNQRRDESKHVTKVKIEPSDTTVIPVQHVTNKRNSSFVKDEESRFVKDKIVTASERSERENKVSDPSKTSLKNQSTFLPPKYYNRTDLEENLSEQEEEPDLPDYPKLSDNHKIVPDVTTKFECSSKSEEDSETESCLQDGVEHFPEFDIESTEKSIRLRLQQSTRGSSVTPSRYFDEDEDYQEHHSWHNEVVRAAVSVRDIAKLFEISDKTKNREKLKSSNLKKSQWKSMPNLSEKNQGAAIPQADLDVCAKVPIKDRRSIFEQFIGKVTKSFSVQNLHQSSSSGKNKNQKSSKQPLALVGTHTPSMKRPNEESMPHMKGLLKSFEIRTGEQKSSIISNKNILKPSIKFSLAESPNATLNNTSSYGHIQIEKASNKKPDCPTVTAYKWDDESNGDIYNSEMDPGDGKPLIVIENGIEYNLVPLRKRKEAFEEKRDSLADDAKFRIPTSIKQISSCYDVKMSKTEKLPTIGKVEKMKCESANAVLSNGEHIEAVRSEKYENDAKSQSDENVVKSPNVPYIVEEQEILQNIKIVKNVKNIFLGQK